MDLVTVTCNRDQQQMLLQAESVGKFLEPCRVWVIVNELNLDGWDKLYQYYPHSDFRLVLAPTQYASLHDGWVSQQVLKLYAASIVKTDYLLLDSKNFFIKPCSLDSWQDQLGCGLYEDYSCKQQTWAATITAYSQYSNLPPKTQYLCMQTPFVINYEVMSSLDLDRLLTWFVGQPITPAEFILYSMLAEKHQLQGKLQQQHLTLWSWNSPGDFNKFIQYVTHTPKILVAGLHRNYLSKIDLQIVNAWLESLGFASRL